MNIKRIQHHIKWTFVLLAVLLIVQCGTPGQEQSFRSSEGFIQSIDDIELYYQVMGSGPDTVIMLHGGPGLNFDYILPPTILRTKNSIYEHVHMQ